MRTSIPTARPHLSRFLLFLLVAGLISASNALAQLVTAEFVYPTNAATGVDGTKLFQWTSAANAQAYYLYVGTTDGAKDVYDSRGTQATSASVTKLPLNSTLFARIYTQVAGVWYFKSISFATAANAPERANLIYPRANASGVDGATPFSWTAPANALGYVLWIGTTPTGNDVLNSGQLKVTSRAVTNLPPSKTLYATVWTRVGDTWFSNGVSFTTASPRSSFIYPLDRGIAVDGSVPFQWRPAANSQGYYLYIGTSPGAKDVHSSGGMPATWTSRIVGLLPPNRTLYATIFANIGGAWVPHSISFSTALARPKFAYPLDGASAVDGAVPFRWTPVRDAEAYRLKIGTSPASNNVYDSAEIPAGTISISVGALPVNRALFATLSVRLAGVWYDESITFTSPMAPLARAVLTYPLARTVVGGTVPFQWTRVDNAQGYYLHVGTSPGTNNVLNSGEMRITSRVVPQLPANQTLYARLWTKIDGVWSFQEDVTFTTTAPRPFSEVLRVALQATANVRAMADARNVAFPGTELERTLKITGHPRAACTDYAATLITVLARANIASVRLGVTFQGNDAHTPVEIFNEEQKTWMVLDPTFSLAVRRSDGLWASAEDIRNAALNQAWDAISYDFLSSSSQAISDNYYIDYPLLYLNVSRPTAPAATPPPSPLPYLQQVAVPVNGVPDYYALRRTQGGSAVVTINGRNISVAFGNVDSLSDVVPATTLSLPPTGPQDIEAYRPRHYVFGLSKARLVYPMHGDTGVAGGQPFQWTAVAAAEDYTLFVGTTPGASNLFNSRGTRATQVMVPVLPAGQTLYATLYTKIAGVWQYNVISFSTP